ncbi:SigB/SigF/SigG family RNA polymerase sigma factor [Nocardiopsis sp. NPDC058631]|uniref:SigB/SigF/SigG family RNA polymerase sigma factor n=1 Tax=Nocardiopsis sp. NPDC058631 TaxID=3346566 RepID=UPI0036571E43
MSTTDTDTLPLHAPSSRGPLVPAPRRPGPGEQDPGEDLLRQFKALDRGDPRAEQLHERVVSFYAPLTQRIARRYAGRGEPVEDLNQTAMVGLCKAIRGFDPGRGMPFLGYLMPTVTGEIKRYFRDHTWAVRVPRSAQENRIRLHRTQQEMTQEMGRTPTGGELGQRLGMTPAQVDEARQASGLYRALSLDAPDNPDSDGEECPALEARIGCEDHRLDLVVDREALRPALARLPARERDILMLRYFYDHTQAEIAERLEYSQMHISRLLRSTLEQLREDLGLETTA